jgi:hypothetical protein
MSTASFETSVPLMPIATPMSPFGTDQAAPAIPEQRGNSVHTVHRHVANLPANLNVHGPRGLLRDAFEHDLVRPSGAR